MPRVPASARNPRPPAGEPDAAADAKTRDEAQHAESPELRRRVCDQAYRTEGQREGGGGVGAPERRMGTAALCHPKRRQGKEETGRTGDDVDGKERRVKSVKDDGHENLPRREQRNDGPP